MQTKDLKINLYALKALQAKGFDLEETLKLSTDEIKALKLSDKIINFVLAIKEYNSTATEEELKEELSEIRSVKDAIDEELAGDVADEYVDIPKEQQFLNSISEPETVLDEGEVVVSKATNPEVEAMISAIVEKIEHKSYPSYIRTIKAEIPAALLATVDASIISAIVNARIKVLKDQSK